MDFYPLEFCTIIIPTELQNATCTNYEEFYLLILFVIVPVGLALHTSDDSFPSLASVCLGLISDFLYTF